MGPNKDTLILYVKVAKGLEPWYVLLIDIDLLRYHTKLSKSKTHKLSMWSNKDTFEEFFNVKLIKAIDVTAHIWNRRYYLIIKSVKRSIVIFLFISHESRYSNWQWYQKGEQIPTIYYFSIDIRHAKTQRRIGDKPCVICSMRNPL